MKTLEDRLHELMDRLDHRENRIQPSDKNLVLEAIQRLRSAYKNVRDLQDTNEKLEFPEQAILIEQHEEGELKASVSIPKDAIRSLQTILESFIG